MDEQSCVVDNRKLGVAEGVHHVAGPSDRKERVVGAPDELDGDVDLPVQLWEFADQPVVEATQELGCGTAMFGRTEQWLRDEFVELAVEQ